ncbi:MAG: 16S rRNA (guanine(527)-N(7))-methyltransferase RsmG [Bacteroidales bacterium]|nr:16S rRNA (guanine(527)-N(7))-methyltransferase RsmG [Bacteroidales bacterium]
MTDIKYIKEQFPFINDRQSEQLAMLEDLYGQWNAKINVISRKDIDNIFIHHILHSLSIAKIVRFQPNTKILDVGTGGGFPGIPLAVLFPSAKFHLIDRIAKKIKVVNAVKDALNLKNVTAEQIPCEEITQKYDFIVSRAVTNLPDFLTITKNKLNNKHNNAIKNGILYLKGNDAAAELADYNDKYLIHNIKDYFKDDFFETKTIVYIPLANK